MITPSISTTVTVASKSNATADTIPPVESPPRDDDSLKITLDKNKKKKKTEACDTEGVSFMSSSSSPPSITLSSTQKTTRTTYKRRNPKVLFAPGRRRGRLGDSDMEAAALPLGMSFAAVVAQVLERKDTAGEKMSVDHLSQICTSAVRESLANVFGDKFDFFARNFEKSFGSTLRTLRLINEASINKEAYYLSHLNVENSASELNLNNRDDCESSCAVKDCHSDTELSFIPIQNQMHVAEEVEESASHSNQELTLREQLNQLVCASSSLGSGINQLSVVEKSVMEQARSNDLKCLEISLTMKKLKLKEEELAVGFDSNQIERSKLAMGISKTSLKADKFKSELEDTRHAELHKNCIDCLVAGLFIMSACLLYGAYVFSYQRITDATASCNPSVEESKSWWIPKPFSSVNSGLHTLKCHALVMSRMLFGILIILTVAYLLLQRSAASRQIMPITFILLLLGAACGFAGKLCVDTLGGSGLLWLIYWETMCLLHFFSNVCTSILFSILHGPLTVSQGVKSSTIIPYWFRQILFYAAVLLFLPLCCGLLPFAAPGEWKDHFLLLATDYLFDTRAIIEPSRDEF